MADSDRRLIARMQTRLAVAQELEAFVTEHLTATYALGAGDRIEDDGRIVRAGEES